MELEETTPSDLPPEYCHYQDDGCELTSSCLKCPFPGCIYDEPRGKQRLLKGLRNREIVRLTRKEGKGLSELAAIFGISQRTVQRALKNFSPGQQSPERILEVVNE